jgi:ComF family protein
MREAIHALKYDRIRPAAKRLGELLAIAIVQLGSDLPRDLLVVPVPLHRRKHRERGFNQARILANCAIAAIRKRDSKWQLTLAPNGLVRLRSTESQAGLTQAQRRKNVRGAFTVSNPSIVRGRNVLLIDDILTTGATARAASQSLIKAGAASVYVATLARARRIHSHTETGAQPAYTDMPSSSSIHQPSL